MDSEPKIICPECNNEFRPEEKLEVGKVIECPSCAIECEVMSISPIQLAPLEEEK